MICLWWQNYYMKMGILVQEKKIAQLCLCWTGSVCVCVFLKKKGVCAALFSQISTYNF